MYKQLSILVIAAATSQLGVTDCGDVLRDPGFDLWCNDRLCAWKIVRGDARRADTWHRGDAGVELIGDDAAIAQLAPVSHIDGTCLEFKLVANVSAEAEARLDFDFHGDGSVEHSERIPTARWEPVSYKLRIARPFTGVRFELAKRGTGTAVFGQISAAITSGCEDLPELSSGPAPLGAYCNAASDCASGLCEVVAEPGAPLGVGRCVGCTASSCTTGEVCGLAEPVSPVLAVPTACVPHGGDELGEQCATDAECASGTCTGLACSTCGPDLPCAGGQPCAAAWPGGPHICAPAGGVRQPGEPCTTAEDCASARCAGTVRQACSDNRPCGNDSNCPLEDGLVSGVCAAVGVQGGTCE